MYVNPYYVVFNDCEEMVARQTLICKRNFLISSCIASSSPTVCFTNDFFVFLSSVQIILGDKSEQKEFTYNGVTCINPGSFSNDGTFAAYRPCTREAELSTVSS